MHSEILLTAAPIQVPPCAWPSREIGACVEFQGVVREKEGETLLAGLYYESYVAMAERQLRRIAEELIRAHGCAAVLFIHRLGWVPVGEASVYVRVMAKHRGPAFAACEAMIERLKQDVPIWKRR